MKGYTRLLVTFVTILSMLFSGSVFSPLQASADASADSVLSAYDYLCASVDDTLGFVYNDGFFFTDNKQLSPELAKVSVALSSAAYDYDCLAQLLDGISCSSVTMMNFDRAHTEEDYDFVRYAIATRRGVSFQLSWKFDMPGAFPSLKKHEK